MVGYTLDYPEGTQKQRVQTLDAVTDVVAQGATLPDYATHWEIPDELIPDNETENHDAEAGEDDASPRLLHACPPPEEVREIQ